MIPDRKHPFAARGFFETVATNLLIGVFLITGLSSCRASEAIPPMSADDDAILSSCVPPEPHVARIAAPDEPGEPLLICLTLLEKESGQPLAGRNVHVYHTTAAGDYEPAVSGDESTARLSGGTTTDSLGRYAIRTILPGSYVAAEGSIGHIHTTVEGAQPDTYNVQFLQGSSFMTRRFVAKSDQAYLVELKRGDWFLFGHVSLRIKGTRQPDE